MSEPADQPSSADSIIRRLGLAPHPEGGHFRETWCDAPAGGSRGSGTAIYYLLKANEVSRWHRIDAVEIWHSYAGDPLELRIKESGSATAIRILGGDIANGELPQIVIPKGAWQSARIPASHVQAGWALVGCTVSPAFQFSGFEMAHDGWEP